MKIVKTDNGLGRRVGNIVVALSKVCADDHASTAYCIDVSEMHGKECVENDHDCSSVPLTATPKQLDAYLTAAVAAASGAYSVAGSVRRLCSTADLAGRCALPGAS